MNVRHAPSTKADAPAAVYVHGLGGASTNWTDLMGLLQGEVEGWAPDLNGFGQSPPPRDGDYSPLGHAKAVAEFIEEELGGRAVHLFGNSLGGAASLQLASRRPELVKTLTLISPALPDISPNKTNIFLPLMGIPGVGESLSARSAKIDVETRVETTFKTCFADPSRIPQQRVDEAIASASAYGALPYASDAFLQSLRGLLKTYLDPGPRRPWKLAERVEAKTLLIYGRQDLLVSARGALKSTKHFKYAQVMVLSDSGHVSQLEHPDVVAEAWIGRFG